MSKVSIIIPTYRRPELLVDRAIPSVLAQETDHELEILVVGDHTDSKTTLLMRGLAKHDKRIRYWNLRKQKLPKDPKTQWLVIGLEARNFGHDQATGEYVGGLDDDDEFTRDHVQVLVDAIEREGADFAYGKSIAFKSGGRIQHYGHWPPGYGAFCDGAAIWRRSLGYRYDKGCIERGMAEDGDLWTRMYEGGVKFTFVPTVVHHYYPNPSGGSA